MGLSNHVLILTCSNQRKNTYVARGIYNYTLSSFSSAFLTLRQASTSFPTDQQHWAKTGDRKLVLVYLMKGLRMQCGVGNVEDKAVHVTLFLAGQLKGKSTTGITEPNICYTPVRCLFITG